MKAPEGTHRYEWNRDGELRKPWTCHLEYHGEELDRTSYRPATATLLAVYCDSHVNFLRELDAETRQWIERDFINDLETEASEDAAWRNYDPFPTP